MQVIRLEHPSNGCGIFHNAHIISDTYMEDDWYHRHNKMTGARLIDGFCKGKHFCAYQSIDELQRWITNDELKEIIHNGFIVLLLDISDFILHHDQVLYDKTSIRFQKEITELFV